MRGFCKVVIAGNLTRDPESRTTPNGASICSFSLAVNRRYTSGGEQKDEVSYFNCSAWGKAGETIQQYLHKGDPILISGRLRQDRWTDKETGKTRSSVEIVVEEFNFISSNNNDSGNYNSGAKSTSEDEAPIEDIPEGDVPMDDIPF